MGSAPHRQLGSFFHGLHKRLELWPADAGQIWYQGHRFIRVNAIVLLHHLPILFRSNKYLLASKLPQMKMLSTGAHGNLSSGSLVFGAVQGYRL
jgi:hypothetical protein